MRAGSNHRFGTSQSTPLFIPGETKPEGTDSSPPSHIRARSLPSLRRTIPSPEDEVGRPLLESPNLLRSSPARKSASLPNLLQHQPFRRVIPPNPQNKSTLPTPLHDDHTYDEIFNPISPFPSWPIPVNLTIDLNTGPNNFGALPKALPRSDKNAPGHNTRETIPSLLNTTRDTDPTDDSVSILSDTSGSLVNIEKVPKPFHLQQKPEHPKSSVFTAAGALSVNATKVPTWRRRNSIVKERPEKYKTEQLPKVPFRTRGDASPPRSWNFYNQEPPTPNPGYPSPPINLPSPGFLPSRIVDQYSPHWPPSPASSTDDLVPFRARSNSIRSESSSVREPSVLVPRPASQEITRESDNAPEPKPTLTKTPTFIPRRDPLESDFFGLRPPLKGKRSPPYPYKPTPAPRPVLDRAVSLNLLKKPPLPTSPAHGDSTVNPEHHDLLRRATSILCRELLKRSGYNSGLGVVEREVVESKLRALANMEPFWKSGIGNHRRERMLFSEALKDGYVLCQ